MLKVVVIDSNAISRNLLTTVLTNGGYEVVGDASPSSAGLASMARLKPQIVCIDIGNPDEEGWGRIDALRSDLPKAVLFMVSGQMSPDTVQDALSRGVHGFIVKPFNALTVLATIRNTIVKLARQHRKATVGDAA